MDQAWLWGILAAIAIGITGAMTGIAPSIIDRAPQRGWWLVVLAPVPIILWNILWIIMANPPDNIRRTLSVIIGAIAGAVILLGATEIMKGPAKAQLPPDKGSNITESGPSTTGSTLNAPNNSGIVTQGQHGNNYMNKDPRSWGFTQEQWVTFRDSLPPSSQHFVVSTRLDDLLAKNFRNQLVALINSVPGWEARDFGDWSVNTLGARGIVLRVPDANQPPPEAQALLKAFLASGTQPTPVFVGGFGAVQIVIGSPP